MHSTCHGARFSSAATAASGPMGTEDERMPILVEIERPMGADGIGMPGAGVAPGPMPNH